MPYNYDKSNNILTWGDTAPGYLAAQEFNINAVYQGVDEKLGIVTLFTIAHDPNGEQSPIFLAKLSIEELVNKVEQGTAIECDTPLKASLGRIEQNGVGASILQRLKNPQLTITNC